MGDPLPISWTSFRGRNGWEPPFAVPDDMGTDAVNVRFVDGGLCKRRPGTAVIATSGDAFDSVAYLAKWVPSTGLANAKLLLVSLNDATIKILSLTTAFAATNLTLTDNVTATYQKAARAVQLNGKLFVAYKSGVNRLHVFDPTVDATKIVRTGLKPTVAPTVANTGGGTYAATPRWYKQQMRTKVGAAVIRQSELSAAVAFTPSGAGTAARVTRGAFPGETETHWVVFGAADSIDGPYYNLSGDIAIGTTTYDDSVVPANYNLNDAAPLAGAYLCFPSVKFLCSDKRRLLGLGVWESAAGDSLTPVPGRVYYSPVIGASDIADDERIEDTIDAEGWIDLAPGGGGSEDRGLAGPINNEIIAFQSKGVYRLLLTGQVGAPVARYDVSTKIGALSDTSCILAEDESGAPCVYFLDPTDGPRRIAVGGQMQWLGRDVADLWRTLNKDFVGAWGEYDSTNKEIVWYVATGSATAPNLILYFSIPHGESQGYIVRKGWAQWTGNAASFLTGVMFPKSAGNEEVLIGGGDHKVLARFLDTRTHDFGFNSGAPNTPVDDPTDTTDRTAYYAAYGISKAYLQLGGTWRKKRLTEAYLLAAASSGAQITQTLRADFGLINTQTSAVSLTATGSETRTRQRFENADLGDWIAIQIQLGDAGDVTNTPAWQLDRYDALIEDTDAR